MHIVRQLRRFGCFVNYGVVLAPARYGTLLDVEDLLEKTNEGTYYTCASSSASLPAKHTTAAAIIFVY